MILRRVRLKNFLSFSDTTINLLNQGFVAVRGENRTDEAKSNGSGKSSWVEAIVWCLTNETNRGTKTVKNRFTTGECEVSLELEHQGDTYLINRVKGKSLTLLKNDIDISGKGIRDTQELIDSLFILSDINFLSATTVLGQGMPSRFTNNKPAGRKEILEKLTKADFQIEEIKNKLTSLKSEKQVEQRSLEDAMLQTQTEITIISPHIISIQDQLDKLVNSEFDESVLQDKIYTVTDKLESAKIELATEQIRLANNQEELQLLEAAENQKRLELEQERQQNLSLLAEKKSSLLQTVSANSAIMETNRKRLLESHTVECPNCHTIFNAEVSLENLESINNKLSSSIALLQAEVKRIIADENKVSQLCFKEDESLTVLREEIKQLKVVIPAFHEVRVASHELELQKYMLELASLQERIKNQQEQKNQLYASLTLEKEKLTFLQQTKLPQLQQAIMSLGIEISDINKLYSFATKEFRGILLEDTVATLQSKAQKLSEQVFNSKDLTIYIDGSALEVEYKGKELEGLSGGERQGVDIILQLALRDSLLSLQQETGSLLVCDEILDNLDAQLSTKIIELISNLGLESVFFITHHGDELQLPYDKELLIIKEKGISRVEQ